MLEDYEGQEERRLAEVLQDPVGTLRRRWRWMLAALVAGSLASAALWLSLEPRFYAEATVVIDRQQVSERVVEPTIQTDAIDRIGAMTARVLSRERLAALVQEHDLYPEAREALGLDEVVTRVRDDVTIEQAPDLAGGRRTESAQVYLVGFESDRPESAADMANALADDFVRVNIDNQHRQHQLATEFLRHELESAERELREQNRAIAEFKRENRGMLPDEEQANLARLALLQQQRQSLALQIAEGETRVVTLSAAADTSPVARLAALQEELRRQLSVHTEKHPDVRALRAEIRTLEAEVAREQARNPSSPVSLMQASEKTLAVLREQLAQTERELQDLDARVERMPAVQEQLAALEEKGAVLREQYTEFLRKVQDSELSESLLLAQQSDRVSVLNRALPPAHPTRERWKFLALGLVASLGLAAALGLALEALDPVLVTPAQVEAAGEIPVIASVPRIS